MQDKEIKDLKESFQKEISKKDKEIKALKDYFDKRLEESEDYKYLLIERKLIHLIITGGLEASIKSIKFIVDKDEVTSIELDASCHFAKYYKSLCERLKRINPRLHFQGDSSVVIYKGDS